MIFSKKGLLPHYDVVFEFLIIFFDFVIVGHLRQKIRNDSFINLRRGTLVLPYLNWLNPQVMLIEPWLDLLIPLKICNFDDSFRKFGNVLRKIASLNMVNDNFKLKEKYSDHSATCTSTIITMKW